MRITKISIQDLFGMPSFTYKIELKTDPPITIIHGPNGSGKTVIFKMIAGLFNSNYFIFWKYPFSEFRVDFD
ncbi:MAG TPA: AAA family ATPase, partial [Phototrophicaceae bacterium]|nr:AAA family ATPase [Phototrophicaceae bacterium]